MNRACLGNLTMEWTAHQIHLNVQSFPKPRPLIWQCIAKASESDLAITKGIRKPDTSDFVGYCWRGFRRSTVLEEFGINSQNLYLRAAFVMVVVRQFGRRKSGLEKSSTLRNHKCVCEMLTCIPVFSTRFLVSLDMFIEGRVIDWVAPIGKSPKTAACRDHFCRSTECTACTKSSTPRI